MYETIEKGKKRTYNYESSYRHEMAVKSLQSHDETVFKALIDLYVNGSKPVYSFDSALLFKLIGRNLVKIENTPLRQMKIEPGRPHSRLAITRAGCECIGKRPAM